MQKEINEKNLVELILVNLVKSSAYLRGMQDCITIISEKTLERDGINGFLSMINRLKRVIDGRVIDDAKRNLFIF